MNTGFLKITRAVEINGRTYASGETVEADRDLAQRLLRERAAVPSAGPGRMLTSPGTVATTWRAR